MMYCIGNGKDNKLGFLVSAKTDLIIVLIQFTNTAGVFPITGSSGKRRIDGVP